ncbi:MAG: hypothetical protein JSV31_21580 [Desulfobacterales bacterium]|nr:MAG: hypothetical protein JSV31_21580 [Desulfobacterales bacterium]
MNFTQKTEDLSDKQQLRAALKQEVTELRSWYELALKQRGRTTVGLSGLDMETIVDFNGAFFDGISPNPPKDLSPAFTLNFAVDDLKAYYYDAVVAQPGNKAPDSAVLDNRFWQDTAASKILFEIKENCLKSDDKMLQLLGKILLIPMAQAKQREK